MEELQEAERQKMEENLLKKKKLINETFEIFKDTETEQIHRDKIINFFNYLGRFIPKDILETKIISELEERTKNLQEEEDKLKLQNEIKEEIRKEAENPKNSNSDKSLDNLKKKENSKKIEDDKKSENEDIEEKIIYIKFFSLEILEPIALEILNSKNYLPDQILKLRECFFLLDPARKGYINKNDFVNIFCKSENSDNFSENEIETFLKYVLSSKDQDKIYYENYCLDLIEFVQNHQKKMDLIY